MGRRVGRRGNRAAKEGNWGEAGVSNYLKEGRGKEGSQGGEERKSKPRGRGGEAKEEGWGNGMVCSRDASNTKKHQ